MSDDAEGLTHAITRSIQTFYADRDGSEGPTIDPGDIYGALMNVLGMALEASSHAGSSAEIRARSEEVAEGVRIAINHHRQHFEQTGIRAFNFDAGLDAPAKLN